MSKDIRSFFKPLNKAAPKKEPALISSDEEDGKSSKIAKKEKVVEKKRRKQVLSDSEDDEPVKKVVHKKTEEKTMENHKSVSASDIFGKGPIKREAATKVVKKPKEPKEVKKNDKHANKIKSELDFHDDDINSTLLELVRQEESASESEKLEKKKLANDNILEKEIKREKSPERKVKREKSEEKSEEKITPEKKPKREKSEEKKPKREKSEEKPSPEKIKSKKENPDEKKMKETKSPKKENETDIKVGVKRKSTKTSSKLDVDKTAKGTKKAKLDVSNDMFEEIIEKKKQSAALYQQFLHRGGARNPGSKEIPEGADYCLAGKSFLVTGVLESLEREEAEELIKKYGGRLLTSVSRKTDYVISGDQPGPSKLSKAESLNIPIISEDELLDLIRTRPAGRGDKVIQSQAKSKERVRAKSPEPEAINPISPPRKKNKLNDSEKPEKLTEKPSEKPSEKTSEKPLEKLSQSDNNEKKNSEKSENGNKLNGETTNFSRTEALVEKYRPQTMKQLIGQQGDKSNAKKFHYWLSNWYKNRSSKVKPARPTPYTKNDDGGFFKAALLSGPPGIGKTTTVYVVTKELGYDLLEFNASDTRSKKLLKDHVTDLLSNTTVKGYFTDDKAEKSTKKHILLMDEVDGMAGNEDRGGVQELIALIKSTDIPIVCVCNDRNNPKMRTLSNYTFDLRFAKPRMEQIKGPMMSLCYKEGIKVNSEELSQLIESTNQDIRQVINHLALLGANIDSNDESQTNKKAINKDMKLGPWDVVRKVFTESEHKTMNIHDKSALFFHDYSISPLFVQENYLSVVPKAPKSELLDRVAKSAESLCIGDIIEKSIRSNGSWSLLPTQAMFSSVIPGSLMSGYMSGAINFPGWLGRNSKRNKMDRLLQEITVHARTTTGASKEAINLDYLPQLRDAITRPLISEDVETSIDVMNQYHLTRDDFDSILEVSLWPGNRNPMQFIETKVKSAFTRAYNKNAATAAYALNATVSKKKKATASQEDEMEGLEDEEAVDSGDEDDDIDVSKLMKTKKAAASKKGSSKDDEKPSTSKKSSKTDDKPKRGRGRGKAQ